MATERIEVERQIAAPPAAIFAVVSDPQGHVLIDSSGTLQAAEGKPARQVDDTFLVHMDREALGDVPLGKYDVTIKITRYEQDAHIEWTITSPRIDPPIGHVYGYQLTAVDGGTAVTSYYDWSAINDDWRSRGIFPVISQAALRATLGILARNVEA
ncbi:MAG TPA: SRPBCC family protein [Pseudonocardiaceae bacterium]|nr:SRPBCC family protein [Pseudonocardiaceae bacterium]